jgi:PPOX class probable F420-dependent enzyme
VTSVQTDLLARHLPENIAWLTTVSPSGKPTPRPVWFVFDGTAFTVFSQPDKAKLKHIENNPHVTLNFNSDDQGRNILVIAGLAEIDRTLVPSTAPGYLEKYEPRFAMIGMDTPAFDKSYSVGIRITPQRTWGF